MRSRWKVLITAVCIAAMGLGGAVAFWYIHKIVEERRETENAQAYRIRAERGDAISQYNLALLYHQGKGVPRDYGEALHWYRLAADQGNAKAEYGLGYLYDQCEGVAQDYSEAVRWYRKSAEAGDEKAQYALGLMFYAGRGVTENRAEAAHWYRKAADQGLAKAQYDLGYMYYYGRGVPEDRTEANRWFQKAANQGDTNAQHMLGLGLTTWRLFILSGLLTGGILLTVGLFIPRKVRWSVQTKRTTIAGVLCFSSAGLNWYGYTHYEAKCPLCGSSALSLLTWTLNGILIVLLMIVSRESKKNVEPARRR